MMVRFSRLFLFYLALVAGLVSNTLGSGAVGSKSSRGPMMSPSKGLEAAITSEPSVENKPAAKAKPKKARTSKPVPSDGDLPQSRNLSKEASGERNAFLRKIDSGKTPDLAKRQDSVNSLSGRDASNDAIFKGASFSPENSDGLRFFNRSSQFNKASDFAKDSSSLSGKRFQTQNFKFRTKPGLPELDMPPPTYFSEREANVPMEKSAIFAGTKARGYSKSSRLVKTFRGKEADRAQRDLGLLNQKLTQSVLASENKPMNLDEVPDRPLNIGEVKSLLNTHAGN